MLAEADNPEEKFDKTMKIYKILKEHFGGAEYLSFVATILADMVSVDTAEAYIARGKRIYELMKNEHPFLTSEEKCQCVFSMYQGLKNAGKNYGKNYELSVLGSLSMMSSDMSAMIEDIVSVDNFLQEQKGYGVFEIDKKTRLMHAVKAFQRFRCCFRYVMN